MKADWAAANLQTIRTLMELSAIYRRALAPVLTLSGVCGLLGGGMAAAGHIDTDRGFLLLWLGTAVVAILLSALLVRRQAARQSEPFWSPPMRRMVRAVAPCFLTGGVAPLINADWPGAGQPEAQLGWVAWWCLMYGCGLHAAGFFLPRGFQRFGWIFALLGLALLAGQNALPGWNRVSPHLLMTAAFGGLHLLGGLYLYFTEKKPEAP